MIAKPKLYYRTVGDILMVKDLMIYARELQAWALDMRYGRLLYRCPTCGFIVRERLNCKCP